MGFSYDEWKKKDNKKKKAASSVPSFKEFKAERQTPSQKTDTYVPSFKSFQYDEQGPKSDKAKQADADRFARGHKSEQPKSEKAKKTDADRFAGNYQQREAERVEKVRQTDADRFAQKYTTEQARLNHEALKANSVVSKPTDTLNRFSTPQSVNATNKKSDQETILSKILGSIKDENSYLNSGDVPIAPFEVAPHNLGGKAESDAQFGFGKGFFAKDNENKTPSEIAGANLRLGVGDTIESFAGLSRWLMKGNMNIDGSNVISDTLQKGADKVREGFEDSARKEEFDWSNPEWLATSLPRALPQSLVSILPGLGAAKGIDRLTKLSKMPKLLKTVLGNVGGAGITATIDSSLEAGGVYDEALRRGMSEEEATNAANDTFQKNFALNSTTTFAEFMLARSGLGKAVGSLGKASQLGLRTAGGGLLEGGQEGVQEAISASSLGDDFKWTDPSTIEAMLLGGILGGGMTGSMAAYGEIKNSLSKNAQTDEPMVEIINRAVNTMPEEVRNEFNQAVNEIKTEGVPNQDAHEMVMEQLLERDITLQENLADATKAYIEDKKLEQQSTELNPLAQEQKNLEEAQAEETTLQAPSEAQNSPLEASNVQTGTIAPPIQETHAQVADSVQNNQPTATAQTFEQNLTDIDKMNAEIMNADGTVNTKKLAKWQKKTEAQTKAAAKNAKSVPTDVKVGDNVNLEGTRADTKYLVEGVEGDSVKLLTPNKVSIKVPKSKIQNVLEREAEALAEPLPFEEGTNAPNLKELPPSETINDIKLPPDFRKDVRQILNELTIDEDLSIADAVKNVKSDPYYAENPEWHNLIDEEAKKMGYEPEVAEVTKGKGITDNLKGNGKKLTKGDSFSQNGVTLSVKNDFSPNFKIPFDAQKMVTVSDETGQEYNVPMENLKESEQLKSAFDEHSEISAVEPGFVEDETVRFYVFEDLKKHKTKEIDEDDESDYSRYNTGYWTEGVITKIDEMGHFATVNAGDSIGTFRVPTSRLLETSKGAKLKKGKALNENPKTKEVEKKASELITPIGTNEETGRPIYSYKLVGKKWIVVPLKVPTTVNGESNKKRAFLHIRRGYNNHYGKVSDDMAIVDKGQIYVGANKDFLWEGTNIHTVFPDIPEYNVINITDMKNYLEGKEVQFANKEEQDAKKQVSEIKSEERKEKMFEEGNPFEVFKRNKERWNAQPFKATHQRFQDKARSGRHYSEKLQVIEYDTKQGVFYTRRTENIPFINPAPIAALSKIAVPINEVPVQESTNKETKSNTTEPADFKVGDVVTNTLKSTVIGEIEENNKTPEGYVSVKTLNRLRSGGISSGTQEFWRKEETEFLGTDKEKIVPGGKKEEAKPKPPMKSIVGSDGTTFTENGTKIEFTYLVVEAKDLIASNDANGNLNPDYPQELQPRDRSREASRTQIQQIAQKLNPELVGESAKASDGAPIIGPDMVVESGNGRTIAMQKMYKEGYDSSLDYGEYLSENSDKFGIVARKMETMKSPILVRMRTNEVNRKQFVTEANVSSIAVMSTTEQAVVDAEKLNGRLMQLFSPGEQGNLQGASNRKFLLGFMDNVVSKSERGRYVDAKGNYSQEFFNRVKNAVFSSAYGSAEALSILSESTDNNVRNITNAMLQSAPRFALMKDRIAEGDLYNADITENIAEAMVQMAELRNSGTSVKSYLDQTSMFDEISNEAKEMLNIFEDKTFKRSAKALTELFNQYVNVLNAAGWPGQTEIFEKSPPTKAEILATAMKRVKTDEKGEVQLSLLEAQPESSNETGTTNGSKGRNQSRAHEQGFAKRKEKVDEGGFNAEETIDTEALDKQVTRSKIIQFIQKEFKVTVGTGRLRGKGVYKTKFHIMRSKDYGDFEVITHELGHHLDNVLNLSTNSKITEELIMFANANLQLSDSMTMETRAAEGVAEYFRQVLYREGQANIGLDQLSHDLHKVISQGISQKGWTKALEDLRLQTTSWLHRDAKQELEGVVTRIGEKQKVTKPFKYRVDEFYTRTFEEGHPIWRAIKDIKEESKKDIDGKNDAYALYRLTRGTVARAATFTSGYTFDEFENRNGESFDNILKDVDDMEEFGQYLVAKRGLYLIEERGKIKTPLTPEKMKQHIEEFSEKYEALAERVYKYQDRLTQVLVDGGLIAPDLPAKMKENDPFYVPFYRVMTEDGVRVSGSYKGGGNGGSMANNQQGIKRMKEQGSARDIINPIESIIKNTHLYFSLADRNRSGAALARLADPNSEHASEVTRDIIEEISNSYSVTEVALKQMQQALFDSGMNEKTMKELDLTQKAKIFEPLFKPNSAQNEILVWVDGKPKLYKVRDELLYNTLVTSDNKLMNDITGSLFWKTAETSNKIKRWGITASIFFTIRTFIRSIMQLAVKTEATNLNYFTQPARVGKAIYSIVKKDDAMYDWWASGGAQSTFITVENEYINKKLKGVALNRKAVDMIRGRYKSKSKQERNELLKHLAANVVIGVPTSLQKFNDILDQSIKLAEFQVVMKQTGGDRVKAAIASRDADLDYRRMGSAGIRDLNKITLFLNVAIQGPDNLARTFAKHKLRTFLRGAALFTLPTILLYLRNRDDEEYQELETWEKDMNWCIPIGNGEFLKVPIPFEVGLLFKTLPEKMLGEYLDYRKGEDKHTFDNIYKNSISTLIPTILPTLASVAVGYMSEKDFTTQRDYVPMALKGLEPVDQYDENTFEIMKWAGKLLDESPKVLQETFLNQFAQMGQFGMFGTEVLLDKTGVVDKPDTKGLKPGYTARYTKANMNDGGTGSITSFYKEKEKMEAAYKSSGIKFDPPTELKRYRKANEDLKTLRQLRNNIMFDKLSDAEGNSFSKEEKKRQIDIINHGMRDVARLVQGKDPLNQEALEQAWKMADNYSDHLNAVDKDARKAAKKNKN